MHFIAFLLSMTPIAVAIGLLVFISLKFKSFRYQTLTIVCLSVFIITTCVLEFLIRGFMYFDGDDTLFLLVHQALNGALYVLAWLAINSRIEEKVDIVESDEYPY